MSSQGVVAGVNMTNTKVGVAVDFVSGSGGWSEHNKHWGKCSSGLCLSPQGVVAGVNITNTKVSMAVDFVYLQ